MQSLYVHFPFCETKCHYCDFYSLGKDRMKPTDPDRFENALYSEVMQKGALLSPVLETIFMGGGTPSMTHHESLIRALEPLWKFTHLSPSYEWTMEANPSSIHLDSLKALRAFGVNRISVGVQSLKPDLLIKLGRVHSRDAALRALDTIFGSGFDNVSVDLLCGVPGQNKTDLDEALKTLTQFPITHLSCYLLTLPPHHRLYPELPKEDEQLSHLLFIHDWMTDRGFEHYEISNYAKPGKKSQHNLNYWRGNSYLGLGPSAHSYDSVTQKRWKNVSSLHKYADLLNQNKSVIEWTEELTQEQLKLEKWMLTLRLSDGFPQSWLEKTIQKSRAKIFEKEGLLEAHPNQPNYLRLTPQGFALSDHIIKELAHF